MIKKIYIKLGIFIFFLISGTVTFSKDLSSIEIYEKNRASIVFVIAHTKFKKTSSQGSGVMILDNIVATNCHVINDSTFISIEQGENQRLGSVIARNLQDDLCLIKTNESIGKPVRLSTNQPIAGEKVYALGHPKNLDLTISDGLISGITFINQRPVIQISAAISSGSSGGGVFNTSGNLVGITTSSLRESQNINFAVPAEKVKKLLVDSAKAEKIIIFLPCQIKHLQ